MLFCKHAFLNFFSLMFVRKLNCILINNFSFLHCTLARVPASVCFNLSSIEFNSIQSISFLMSQHGYTVSRLFEPQA